MLAFVTGATGFVGSHVAKQLAARGADLRLLVRPTSRKETSRLSKPTTSPVICAMRLH